MKRFDKGYIYSNLLSDLFKSIVLVFLFFSDIILDDEATLKDISVAIPFLAGAFCGIYLCLIVYRILYYRTSGYQLCENEIKCNRGVLFRKRSVLEYSKVHAINKKQSIFHRIFGIAVLTVDSGSTNTSHQAEIIIIEKSKTVDALLDKLNALKEGKERAATDIKDEVLLSDKDSLYRFTSKRKMLYSLINIATTAFSTALVGALAVVAIGICNLLLQLDTLSPWGEYYLIAILVTLGAMLLFSAISFIGSLIHSFIGYYNFTITKRGNDIQISFGLLERHTNTFSYDRIKAVKITQGLVQRMLGFASITLEVIGYTNDSGNDNSGELGILVPFCKYREVDEILYKVLPDFIPDKKQTSSVSYFPYISWFALILGIVVAVALLQTIISLMIFNVSPTVIGTCVLGIIAAGVIIFGIKAFSAALAYQNNGLCVSNGKITAYYGGFTKIVTVFMAKNLIAAENVTTPLRKKAGITSLVLHVKTNAVTNEVKVHIQSGELSEKAEGLLIL